MRSLILVMSIMGSYIFILYLLLKPILKKFFSVKVRITFILVSSIFYLVPFPIFKNYYFDVLNILFNIESFTRKKTYKIIEPIRVLSDQNIVFSKFNAIVLTVTLILAVIFITASVLNYKSYRSLKRKIFLASTPINDEDITVTENILIKNNNKINLRVSDKYKPLTIGYFKPIILLPQNSVNDKSTLYVLKHELAHLKHKDFILKILMYSVVCPHWFNILVYIMLLELNALVEYHADEVCIESMNKDEREEYIDTVIRLSEKKSKATAKFTNSFGSDNEAKMKERINEMKKTNKHSKLNSIISGIILTAAAFSCSMIVFAYEDAPIYKDNDFNQGAEVFFSEDNSEEIFLEENLITPNNIISEWTFVDENGSVYDIDELISLDGANSPNALCNHTYVSGTIQEHIVQSNGGCIVKIYNGQRCTKCGAVIKGSLISTTTYTVCPH